MKFTSTLAVIALLGSVSTHKVNSLKRVDTPDGVMFLQRESDGLANGDKTDDKEIQDADDDEDDAENADDTGFVNRFKYVQTKSDVRKGDDGDLENTIEVYKAHLAKPDIATNSKGGERYSDKIANADHADDKDLENEADDKDDVVDENLDPGMRTKAKLAQKKSLAQSTFSLG